MFIYMCVCLYVCVSECNCEFYAYLPTNPPPSNGKHFFDTKNFIKSLKRTKQQKQEQKWQWNGMRNIRKSCYGRLQRRPF